MKLDPQAFVAEERLLSALEPRSIAVNCDQDRTLFSQGDEATGLFIFHGGEVTLSMVSPEGLPVVDIPAVPGSLLGLPALLGNVGYSLSACAQAGAKVSFVEREEFSRLMLTEPLLAMMILKVLAAEVRTARMALANQ